MIQSRKDKQGYIYNLYPVYSDTYILYPVNRGTITYENVHENIIISMYIIYNMTHKIKNSKNWFLGNACLRSY